MQVLQVLPNIALYLAYHLLAGEVIAMPALWLAQLELVHAADICKWYAAPHQAAFTAPAVHTMLL